MDALELLRLRVDKLELESQAERKERSKSPEPPRMPVAISGDQLRRMGEAAAKVQAISNTSLQRNEQQSMAGFGVIPTDFVSRRSDGEAITVMGNFIRRLLDPEDLFHAVSYEVYQAACRALDLPKA